MLIYHSPITLSIFLDLSQIHFQTDFRCKKSPASKYDDIRIKLSSIIGLNFELQQFEIITF